MIECTIEDLYNFEKQTGLVVDNFKTETRYGMKNIEAIDITSYNSPIIETVLESGLSIKTSPDHQLWSDDWTYVKDLNVGDKLLTKNGVSRIISSELLQYKDDLYDIQVNGVHEFYANNIVSHNSVLVDALNFSLFGKPFRKTTIPNSVNNINGRELEIQLDFVSDGKEYSIIRGIKPNKFDIYCQGELLNQDSHKRDYQKYLEENIYKFNSNIFEQVAVKSLTKYESFLTLAKNKKRQIIEELFEITVISEMFELNKIKRNELESLTYGLKSDLIHQKNIIDQEIDNLEKLKSINLKISQEIEEEHKEINNKIKELREEIENLNKGFDIIQKKEDEKKQLSDNFKKLMSLREKYLGDLNKISNSIKLFDERIIWMKQKCPNCLRVDEIELEDEDVSVIRKEKKIIEKKYEDNERKIKILSDKIDNLNKIIQKKVLLNQKIKDINKVISDYKKRLNKKKGIVEIDESNLKEYKKNYLKINKDIKETERELQYIEVISEILQDDGIKSYIISKYIPLLNKLLNTYLQKFGLDVELEFTSSFDIDIKNNYKVDMTYDNFSSGQKKRIDASIIFCFLDFCKLKYNTAKLNVLIFDEFAVGLDQEGEGMFYEILRDISNKENMEIITVSQNPLIDPDKIDNMYMAEMNQGFSKLIKMEEN